MIVTDGDNKTVYIYNYNPDDYIYTIIILIICTEGKNNTVYNYITIIIMNSTDGDVQILTIKTPTFRTDIKQDNCTHDQNLNN